MKIRYKGQKPAGMPIYIPVSSMKSASLMAKAKLVWVNPVAEIPDADAKWLIANDPHNFELAQASDRAVETVDEEISEGLELDPDKKPIKRRGRPAKAKVEPVANEEAVA